VGLWVRAKPRPSLGHANNDFEFVVQPTIQTIPQHTFDPAVPRTRDSFACGEEAAIQSMLDACSAADLAAAGAKSPFGFLFVCCRQPQAQVLEVSSPLADWGDDPF
jgi:hypothetical protein